MAQSVEFADSGQSVQTDPSGHGQRTEAQLSLLLNMLSKLVIAFLPRSKRLLISRLQSPSAARGTLKLSTALGSHHRPL